LEIKKEPVSTAKKNPMKQSKATAGKTAKK
jgi:hypothetical protein